jgi:tetratricopeptide (TPR) repeat protein
LRWSVSRISLDYIRKKNGIGISGTSSGGEAMKYSAVLAACSLFACMALQAGVPAGAADSISSRLAAGGAEEVIRYIREFQPCERLELYRLAREIMVFQGWEGQNLDDISAVSEEGIQEAMDQANRATDQLSIEILLDMANVMSYDLSADLAICWPGDTMTRARRHFERGLSAALQCIEWRRELEKGDYSLFLAYWAAGMHQLSLGRHREAVYNLVKSLNHAQQFTIDQGRPLGLAPQVGFELILAHGYLGLAMELCGYEDDQYERAIRAFREGMELYPELAEDYGFGIDQLERARGILTGD